MKWDRIDGLVEWEEKGKRDKGNERRDERCTSASTAATGSKAPPISPATRTRWAGARTRRDRG